MMTCGRFDTTWGLGAGKSEHSGRDIITPPSADPADLLMDSNATIARLDPATGRVLWSRT
jgi:hypothetical protein